QTKSWRLDASEIFSRKQCAPTRVARKQANSTRPTPVTLRYANAKCSCLQKTRLPSAARLFPSVRVPTTPNGSGKIIFSVPPSLLREGGQAVRFRYSVNQQNPNHKTPNAVRTTRPTKEAALNHCVKGSPLGHKSSGVNCSP